MRNIGSIARGSEFLRLDAFCSDILSYVHRCLCSFHARQGDKFFYFNTISKEKSWKKPADYVEYGLICLYGCEHPLTRAVCAVTNGWRPRMPKLANAITTIVYPSRLDGMHLSSTRFVRDTLFSLFRLAPHTFHPKTDADCDGERF